MNNNNSFNMPNKEPVNTMHNHNHELSQETIDLFSKLPDAEPMSNHVTSTIQEESSQKHGLSQEIIDLFSNLPDADTTQGADKPIQFNNNNSNLEGISKEVTPTKDESPIQFDVNKIKNDFKDLSTQERSDTEKWIQANINEPFFRGLAGLLDIPVMAGNAVIYGANKLGANIPYGEYPSEAVGNFVSRATGVSDDDIKKHQGPVGKAVQFGTEMATGGVAGKTLKEGSKVAQYLGSTKKGDVALAGTAGYATGVAEDMGADPLTAAGVGLGTSVAGSGVKMLGHKLLNTKNMDVPAHEAGKRIGVDLDLNDVANSKLVNFVDYTGSKISNKVNTSKINKREQLLEARDHIADGIGPKVNKEAKVFDKNDLTTNTTKNLYDEAENLISENIKTVPENTLKTIDKYLKQFKLSATRSSEQNEIIAHLKDIKKTYASNFDIESVKQNLLKQGLQEGTHAYNQAIQQVKKMPAKEISLPELISTKESLNSLHDGLSKSGQKTVRDMVKSIMKDVEIADPKFQQARIKADEYYKKVKAREEFDKVADPNTLGTAEFLQTSTVSRQLKKALEDETFLAKIGKHNVQKVKDLQKTLETLTNSNRRSPNPSGTAATDAIFKVVTAGVFYLASNNPLAFLKGLTAYQGAKFSAEYILTNKNILNGMIDYAKDPIKANKDKLKRIFKAQTRISFDDFVKSLANENEDIQGGQSVPVAMLKKPEKANKPSDIEPKVKYITLDDGTVARHVHPNVSHITLADGTVIG